MLTPLTVTVIAAPTVNTQVGATWRTNRWPTVTVPTFWMPVMAVHRPGGYPVWADAAGAATSKQHRP